VWEVVLFFRALGAKNRKKAKLLCQSNYDDLPLASVFVILGFLVESCCFFMELKEILWHLQQYSYHLL
jgi:hypothetical protein